MRNRLLALALLLPLSGVPIVAAADAPALTRRDGYLLLWQSIRRPAYETHKEFTDVPFGDPGHLEISYGKRRGILDDAKLFRPDDLLTKRDALLWLYRTRNVAELPDMQVEDLPRLLQRYPVYPADQNLDELMGPVENVLNLMRELDTMLREEVHEVSYYADDFHGQGTAFGETFDMHALTAAHRSLPHNTMVRVTNLENNQSIVVRINDRGPYIEGRDLDLSLASFEAISPLSRGVLRARFERLGDEEMIDECTHELRRYQRRIVRSVHFNRGVPHRLTLGDTLTLASTKFFVVRWVQYPDGYRQRIEQWVNPEADEKYHFKPALPGTYTFWMSTAFGRGRAMQMEVVACSAHPAAE